MILSNDEFDILCNGGYEELMMNYDILGDRKESNTIVIMRWSIAVVIIAIICLNYNLILPYYTFSARNCSETEVEGELLF